MQIQFKQAEITAALKQYIVAQGINLSGKSVDIAFSATRGAAGIVADVTIEEVDIPGFSDSVGDDTAKPVLAVVQPAVAKAAIATEAKAEPMAEAQADTGVAAEAPKTTSLFGG